MKPLTSCMEENKKLMKRKVIPMKESEDEEFGSFQQETEAAEMKEVLKSHPSQTTRTTSELASSSPNFCITPDGGRLIHVRFSVHRAHKHGGFLVDRVSNLEPYGCEAKTLSLGHRGFLIVLDPSATVIVRLPRCNAPA
ncbi:hypothetical protein AVEN_256054-1 [Araneus ventricosus]|uniref:Uncharacterized protein n=1 Tax=Araneus ventricosus TaxID=182803 RepID=A0A4Y2LQ21_ARAVE|nr:hypothetical protein AVEN_256054-1 [Araneus ventricosus]